LRRELPLTHVVRLRAYMHEAAGNRVCVSYMISVCSRMHVLQRQRQGN
jgi:hypothetical protein